MFRIKPRFVYFIIFFSLIFILASCADQVVMNEISVLDSYTPPYIEGAHDEEITAEDFKSLTGMDLQNSLPESDKNEEAVYYASYDGNDEILCLFASFGDENNYTSLSVFSKKLWSDQTYYPIDFNFQNETYTKTTIMNVPAVFVHYDDSKSEADLGYDIYLAEFTSNDIGVNVASHMFNQNEFVSFVKKLIENTNRLE